MLPHLGHSLCVMCAVSAFTDRDVLLGIVFDRFYKAPFSALEQTHSARL